jgi:hypothetical protein
VPPTGLAPSRRVGPDATAKGRLVIPPSFRDASGPQSPTTALNVVGANRKFRAPLTASSALQVPARIRLFALAATALCCALTGDEMRETP